MYSGAGCAAELKHSCEEADSCGVAHACGVACLSLYRGSKSEACMAELVAMLALMTDRLRQSYATYAVALLLSLYWFHHHATDTLNIVL